MCFTNVTFWPEKGCLEVYQNVSQYTIVVKINTFR